MELDIQLTIMDPETSRREMRKERKERDAHMKRLRETGVKSLEGIIETPEGIESIDDGD